MFGNSKNYAYLCIVKLKISNMKINKNHIKIGQYIIQYDWEQEGFIVIDEEDNQYGAAEKHVCDAIERVMMWYD